MANSDAGVPGEERGSDWDFHDAEDDNQWEEYAREFREQDAVRRQQRETERHSRDQRFQVQPPQAAPAAQPAGALPDDRRSDTGRQQETQTMKGEPSPQNDQNDSGGLMLVLVIGSLLVFGLGGLVLAVGLWFGSSDEPADVPLEPVAVASDAATVRPADAEQRDAAKKPKPPLRAATDVPAIQLGVAYGTEKKRWFTEAVKRFEGTPEGQRVRVKLLPMGSLESAHALLDRDQRIHVWCPASSMYRDVFVTEWQIKFHGEPIASEEMLALTPMVFVIWQDRYDAFQQQYEELTFSTVSQALHAEGGWSGIADRADWGLFKFGHTHPLESNSGLQALVLMAYDFHEKTAALTVPDIVSSEFQRWLGDLERGVSGLSNSTGTMMREMVLKGPSSFDSVVVYESVAIDYLKNAEGRWGKLHIEYPKYNMWNDNPYYVLATDWTTDEHHRAAGIFLDFLMTEPIQELALTHGFRPGNPEVPVKFPESPFLKYERYGLKIDLPTVCESPAPDVINNLQQVWQRSAGR
jgi:hypothetical protein